MASATSLVSPIIPFSSSSSSSSKLVSIISDKYNSYIKSSFHGGSTTVSSTSFINPSPRNARNLETLVVRAVEEDEDVDLDEDEDEDEYEYEDDGDFPAPIPEFADAETENFKVHLSYYLLDRLIKRLAKKFEHKPEELTEKRRNFYKRRQDEVVEICTEIFKNFMHTEYGGPGTLLIDPFLDMYEKTGDRELGQGPEAATYALKWARRNVDKDWEKWIGS